MSIGLIAAGGGTIQLGTVTMQDGSQAVMHVLCDAAGVPYSAAHPLLTAPAILAVTPVDRSGSVATSGATALDVTANAARKGGWFRAGANNQGVVTITLKNQDGSTHSDDLEAGATYPLTINGYVIQTEILVTGTVPGDTFKGVEFL